MPVAELGYVRSNRFDETEVIEYVGAKPMRESVDVVDRMLVA